MATNTPLLPVTPTVSPAESNLSPSGTATLSPASEIPVDRMAVASVWRAGFGSSRLPLAAAACGLLVVVGSLGTWGTLNMTVAGVSVEIGSFRGTSGSDGKLTVALGLLAAFAMLLRARRPARWRWLAWAAPIPFALAALTGGYDWWHLRRIADAPFLQGTGFTTDAGWGMVVTTLGGAAGGILALAAAVTRRQPDTARPEPVTEGESPRAALSSLLLVLVVGLVGLAPTAAAVGIPSMASTYTVADLGTLGGGQSGAKAINAAGQVVGWSTVGPGQAQDTSMPRAVQWDDGTMTDLGTLGGHRSTAWGINATDQVVGAAETAGGGWHAVLWNHGLATDLNTIGHRDGGEQSEALAINDTGQVVGWSNADFGSKIRAVLWDKGEITDLGALPGGEDSKAFGINAAGQIVGISTTAPGQQVFGGAGTHAVLWDHGMATDLGTLGGEASEAYGINDAGQVVGVSTTASGQELFGAGTHAVLWDHGTATDLGTLGGETSAALGIDDAGRVVGESTTAGGQALDGIGAHAFVWATGTMTDLGTLGGETSVATASNAAGQVVGASTSAPGQKLGDLGGHAARWLPTDAPATPAP